MAIEKTTIVRPASRPSPSRPEITLGSLLRVRNIEIIGSTSVSRLRNLPVLPEVHSRLMKLLEGKKYMVIGQGISLQQIAQVFNGQNLAGLLERGTSILALGRISSVRPPLTKYLSELLQAIKIKDLKTAREALPWARALAEESGEGTKVRGEIVAAVNSRLDTLAESCIKEGSPQETLDFFLELGEHDLHQALLVKLASYSIHERKLESLGNNAKAVSDYLKKNKITPAWQQVFKSSLAQEAEAELCLQLVKNFPREKPYLKHYLEMCLRVGDLIDAQNVLRCARASGLMDREFLSLSDQLRAAQVENYLKDYPETKKTLEGLFDRLKRGNFTLENFDQVLGEEMGFEYFICQIIKLLNEKRLAAYQAVSRLPGVAENGGDERMIGELVKALLGIEELPDVKIGELKSGIFGRIINDALEGKKLLDEEKALLGCRELLISYAHYNPERARIFAETIGEMLEKGDGRRGRVAHRELLIEIYRYLALETEKAMDPEPITVEDPDQELEPFRIETDDDIRLVGRKLLDWGKPEQLLERSRTYSRQYPGHAGYGLEVMALLELGRLDEARTRFAEVKCLVEDDRITLLEEAVAAGRTYDEQEIESYLKYLISQDITSLSHRGRKVRMRGYSEENMAWLLEKAAASTALAVKVFSRLKQVFVEQAGQLEGTPAAMGFIIGQLAEIMEGDPHYTPELREAFDNIFPEIHLALMRYLNKNRKEDVLAIRPLLKKYAQVLQATYHFKAAAETLELLIPDTAEQDEVVLDNLRLTFLAAVNWGNQGETEKAKKLHLRVARMKSLAIIQTEMEILRMAERETDYFATNFALLANLYEKPEEIEYYLKKAWAERPRSEASRSNIATALIGLGRYAEAGPFLEGLFAEYPHSLSVQQDLAKVLMETGRVEEAFNLVSAFVAENRADAHIMAWPNNLLCLLAFRFNHEPARKLLEEIFSQISKEGLKKFVPTMPPNLLRRLSQEFLTFLGIESLPEPVV